MNQEVMNLFSAAVQPQVFDQIQISIASPEKILSWSFGEIKAGDNQLPHLNPNAMDFSAPGFSVRSRITSACAANTSG